MGKRQRRLVRANVAAHLDDGIVCDFLFGHLGIHVEGALHGAAQELHLFFGRTSVHEPQKAVAELLHFCPEDLCGVQQQIRRLHHRMVPSQLVAQQRIATQANHLVGLCLGHSAAQDGHHKKQTIHGRGV